MIVVDASAVLAIVFEEPGADAAVGRIADASILAVNAAEIILKLADKGWQFEEAVDTYAAFALELHHFDEALAIETARLHMPTRKTGLSFGDKACLALARRLGAIALTADRAWANLDIGCKIELVR